MKKGLLKIEIFLFIILFGIKSGVGNNAITFDPNGFKSEFLNMINNIEF